MPTRGHSCVCGQKFTTFTNLRIHRKRCDSWAEHQAGIRRGERAQHAPSAQDLADGPYECPYCLEERDTARALETHLKYCSKATSAFQEAFVSTETWQGLVDAARWVLIRADRHAAFERWCTEHGR